MVPRAVVLKEHIRLSTVAMACRFELLLEGEDYIRLRSAGEEALAEIERLDAQLSRFIPSSDVSWINSCAAAGPVKVEPQLFELLRLACELSHHTDYAFDITVAPLMRLWGFGQSRCQPPTTVEIEQARKFVGVQHILLDGRNYTVQFDLPGVQIDLGAIGKGFAVDCAVQVLRLAGVKRALLHGGTSTVFALGEWKVGVRAEHVANADKNAARCVVLCDSAVSVSAIHGRFSEAGGNCYGHVMDPRTGKPVAHTQLAAVWGKSATYCDALSTALLVMGGEWLPKMTSIFPGYDGMVLPAT